MSGPIFNSTVTGSSGGNRHLVEFKSGRMNMVGKMVHPDQRKGLIYLYQAEDGLIHFCWKDRNNGKLEEDLIIFPEDCEFKRVDQCKTGRVYLLKFMSSSRIFFFWMQEPETDNDEALCRRVNNIMNNPPSASPTRSGEVGDLQNMLNNMSRQQLRQIFGQMNRPSDTPLRTGRTTSRTSSTTTIQSSTPASGGITTALSSTTPSDASIVSATPQVLRRPTTRLSTTASTGVATSSTGEDLATAIQNATGRGAGGTPTHLLSEFKSYLSKLKTNEGAGTASGGRSVDLRVDLSTAMNSELVTNIVDDADRMNALLAHLPTVDNEDSSKTQLKDTLSSPQFQQALSMFSSALQSGQLGPVVSQFQLSGEAIAAANSGDLEQFVKALEKTSGDSGSADKKDKETPMEEDK